VRDTLPRHQNGNWIMIARDFHGRGDLQSREERW
jgi:hypothetical protein